MYYNLKNLRSIFDKVSHTTSPPTAFNAILDHALLPFQYFPTGEALQKAHKLLQDYSHRELLQDFLRELANLNPDGFGDPLGEFYMEEISHGHLGQFFTPEHITTLIARMQVGDPQTLNGKSMLDPACGSGRFILAMAKMNRHMLFFGADLDLVCCKMTLLNMLLNSLSGEIAHMNSITNEFYRGYAVQTKLIDGYHYPYFVEFSEAEKSYIWLRPVKQQTSPVFVQGDLFKNLL